MRKTLASDRERIEVLLSSSPHYLKLADSILKNLDSKSLADLIASYLYFKSNGRGDREFAEYVLSEKFSLVLSIGIGIAPVIVPAMIFDKAFRTTMTEVLVRSLVKTGK